LAASLVALHTTRSLTHMVLATEAASKPASAMIFGIIFLRSPLKGQSGILRWKNEWHIRFVVRHDDGL
jgi:hypothetical protein